MKPGDFLLSVFDFFAILLPGAMATWLVVQYVPAPTLRRALMFGWESPPQPSDFVVGAAFLVASYTFGHFVSMLGAELDPSYDRWRQRTKPHDRDTTYLAARKLHQQLSGEILEFTTLKWGKAYIQIKASQARTEIERLETDQKFFRSMVVVSAGLVAHFFLHEASPVAGLAAIAMGALSYRRYLDQRWKMSELIFATVVIAHATTTAHSMSASMGEDRLY
jgi:hypothetical protein